MLLWLIAIYFRRNGEQQDAEQEWAKDYGLTPKTIPETMLLVGSLSVDVVEPREIIYDPLNAALAEALRYLTGAWQAFLAEAGEADELWSFTTDLNNMNRPPDHYEGYAWVKNGSARAYILTVNKTDWGDF